MYRCIICMVKEKLIGDRWVIVHLRTCPDYARPGHTTERPA